LEEHFGLVFRVKEQAKQASRVRQGRKKVSWPVTDDLRLKTVEYIQFSATVVRSVLGR
jgi:hypothetical protein